MITREEAERLRDELLSVLAEDAHNTQRLLARLDSIARESGIGAHAALLLILTRLAFEETEARGHWEAILAHRDELTAKLGRDSGIRVAVLDYFMNVNRRLTRPTLIDLEMLDAEALDAAKDRLTGLATDTIFRTSIQHELRRAKRYGQKTVLALLDLDDFGAINQKFGTLIGDRLLREAAIMVSNKIRDIDFAARPGDDEVALLLPETDRNGGLLVTERIRRELEEYFAGRECSGQRVELTVSAGIACYPEDATTPETLITGAAQALYQAKASGKNNVQVYRPERRRYLRFELEPGEFEVEVLSPSERAAGRLRNLSRNGILFASPEPLEVGEEIEIRLADGEDEVGRLLRLRGIVVRLEQLPGEAGAVAGDRYEIGVAFDLEQPGAQTDDLLSFLEQARGRMTDRHS